jgi:hypothetical protein
MGPLGPAPRTVTAGTLWDVMQTPTTRQPLSPARRVAYRRLALTILGADIQTLTAQLQARREERAASVVELRPSLDKAA